MTKRMSRSQIEALEALARLGKLRFMFDSCSMRPFALNTMAALRRKGLIDAQDTDNASVKVVSVSALGLRALGR